MRRIQIPKEKIEYVIQNFPFKKDACDYLGVSISTLNRHVDDYGLTYVSCPSQKGVSHIKTYQYIRYN